MRATNAVELRVSETLEMNESERLATLRVLATRARRPPESTSELTKFRRPTVPPLSSSSPTVPLM